MAPAAANLLDASVQPVKTGAALMAALAALADKTEPGAGVISLQQSVALQPEDTAGYRLPMNISANRTLAFESGGWPKLLQLLTRVASSRMGDVLCCTPQMHAVRLHTMQNRFPIASLLQLAAPCTAWTLVTPRCCSIWSQAAGWCCATSMCRAQVRRQPNLQRVALRLACACCYLA